MTDLSNDTMQLPDNQVPFEDFNNSNIRSSNSSSSRNMKKRVATAALSLTSSSQRTTMATRQSLAASTNRSTTTTNTYNNDNNEMTTQTTKSLKKRKTSSLIVKESKTVGVDTTIVANSTSSTGTINCLPRTLEMKQLQLPETTYVIGIDEAGRGPLAGPVVAAAVTIPDHLFHDDNGTLLSSSLIDGIVDSKKITNEHTRNELYQQIIQLPNIIWAVCIIDNTIIDQMNILQATLFGMQTAASTVMNAGKDDTNNNNNDTSGTTTTTVAASSIPTNKIPVFDHNYQTHPLFHRKGSIPTVENATTTTGNDNHPESTTSNKNDSDRVTSYVLFGCNQNGIPISKKEYVPIPHDTCYAYIDGNQKPKNMMCESQPIVKGDSKEYIIAVASILAKVTRDQIMTTIYDPQYPQYKFKQHKGYPTREHKTLIEQYGITPIHRKTFAPIKDMDISLLNNK